MDRHTLSFARAAILAALSVAAAAVAPAPASAASVSGTVRDAATLDPVAGIGVTLHVLDPDSVAFSTTSGPDGAYSITGAPGDNRLYVLTGGGGLIYAGFYARLPVPDPAVTFDVLLDSLQVPEPGEPPDSTAILGRILSASGGEAVAGATVTLSTDGTSYEVTTDADGRFDVTLPPGTYTAHVEADGYEPVSDAGLDVDTGGLSYNAFLVSSTTDTPPPGWDGVAGIRAVRPNPLRGSTEIHYVLAAAGRVDLAVYDLGGRAVARLESGWKDAGAHVATFSAAGLPAGLYFCHLRAPGLSMSRRVAVLP